jgi:hypothetical protein
MSVGLNVYAVSLERLKQIVGSRDQAMIDAIVEGHEDFLSSIDDICKDAELTCVDVVAELINGELSENTLCYLYGYAFEAICSHVAEELPNICPISGASDWIEEVDALLEGKDIPIRLNELVFGGSPVPIPEPDDYPSIGKWTAAELAAARVAFEATDLTDVEPDMAETLQQIRDWVAVASKKPGAAVVGFLS